MVRILPFFFGDGRFFYYPFNTSDAIAPRSAMGVTKTELKPGEARKTLRMKTGGAAVVEEEPASEVLAVMNAQINRIDELLEQFVGIRDNELSTTMYHIAKECKEVILILNYILTFSSRKLWPQSSMSSLQTLSSPMTLFWT